MTHLEIHVALIKALKSLIITVIRYDNDAEFLQDLKDYLAKLESETAEIEDVSRRMSGRLWGSGEIY